MDRFTANPSVLCSVNLVKSVAVIILILQSTVMASGTIRTLPDHHHHHHHHPHGLQYPVRWTKLSYGQHHQRPVDVMTDVINDIGVKILERYIEHTGNVGFSPSGLGFVVVALYEGSAGSSSRQISEVFGLPNDRRITRIGLRDIHRRLRSYLNADAFLGGLTLNRDDINLRPEYEDILRFYGFDISDSGNTTTADLSTNPISLSVTTGTLATGTIAVATDAVSTPPNPTTINDAVEIITNMASNQNSALTMGSTSGATLTTDVPTTINAMSQSAAVINAASTNITATAATTMVATNGPTVPSLTTPISSPTMTDTPSATTMASMMIMSIIQAIMNTMNAPATMVPIQRPVESLTIAADMQTQSSDGSTVLLGVSSSDSIAATSPMTTVSVSMAAMTNDSMMQRLISISTQGPADLQARSSEGSTLTVNDTVGNTLPMTSPTNLTMAATMNPTNAITSPTTNFMTTATTNPTNSVTNPTTNFMTTATTNPTNSITNPTTNFMTTATTNPTNSVTNPTTNFMTEAATNPMTNPTTNSVTEALTNPITNATTSLTTNSVTETMANPITNAATSPTTNFMAAATTGPITDASTNITTSPITSLPTIPMTTMMNTSTMMPETISVSDSTNGTVMNSSMTMQTADTVTTTIDDTMTNNVRKRRSVLQGPSGYFSSSADDSIWLDVFGRLNSNDEYQSQDEDIVENPNPSIQLDFLVNGCDYSRVTAATYTAILPFAYFPYLRTSLLEFPLDDPRYKILVMLPSDSNGTRRLVRILTTKSITLRHLRRSLQPTWVTAIIPSFMLRGFVTLTPYLQRLGISDVFEPRTADLSPMSPDLGVYARDIQQSIGINIRNNMKGGIGGADGGNGNQQQQPQPANLARSIRGIVGLPPFFVAEGAISPQSLGNIHYSPYSEGAGPIPFVVDRPFLYFIIDDQTSVSLLAGRIDDPLNSRILL